MADDQPDERERERALDRVVQWGDPVLRAPTRPVERFDGDLQAQAASMLDLMRRAHGAGLAAPQVGSLRRLLVYAPGEDAEPRALVNARVVEHGDETAVDVEGCLSLGRARVVVEVERPREVVVEAQDLDGDPVRIEAVDREARVLQHEIDHLDGVLMLERTSPEQRREAVRALREGRAWLPPGVEAGDEVDA